MTFFYRNRHRQGNCSGLVLLVHSGARAFLVPVGHAAAGLLIFTVAVCLAAGAGAQARMEATTDDTLQITRSVENGLAEQWRRAIDEYRRELRQGQQIAPRPLSQQSTELGLLRDHLRSAGYYNFDLQARPSDDYETLRYIIEPGQRFRIRNLNWDWPDDLESFPAAQADIQSGQPLVAADVLSAQTRLRREIMNTACYYRVNVQYEVTLDRDASVGDIRFYMEPSPQVTIADVTVNGATTVRGGYPVRLTQLEPGDCFQRPRLDQARLNLYDSNLFARVNEQVSAPDENNQVSITYDVQERNHRTLKLGAGYDSDVGIGTSAEWTHRNFSQRGERLVLGTNLSQLAQSVNVSLTIPRRYTRRPIITFSSRFERSVFDDVPTYLWQKGINFEQNLWANWVGNLGIDVRTTWDDNSSGLSDYEQWLALPTSVVRDTRDDLLDPRYGTRLLVGFTPNYSLSGTQDAYGTLRTAGRAYGTLADNFTLAVASEVTVLMGLGTDLDLSQLPASERLYAGGGGSVRGWAFQGVPPTDGGRLRFVSSIEQRVRIGENWGGVIFADGAWLSRENNLALADGEYGVGLGVRYFTAFAPLRADIATPLNDVGRLRFYFSIGQAF